ncbi:MAG: class I SAM-dependent methyltransferase [Burkholderiaceae bacterium]|nr:class I SAM-dependent methyltransferase [Burkholderiaceae bacterium]
MKEILGRIPVVGALARRLHRTHVPNDRSAPQRFPGSEAYWEQRYASGGNSGVGSYTFFAEFKAEVLNRFVREHDVQSVIEFGCGDGNQLALAGYPAYLGFDVSSTAVAQCRARFESDPTKRFATMEEYAGESAELALSLDVIYHLIEDDVYERYMRLLFDAAKRYAIVYASDTDDNAGYEGTHVKHRRFTRWVRERRPEFALVEQLPNRYPYRGDYHTGSFAEFFVYRRS